MEYNEMLKELYSVHPEAKIKLGLDRIKELLERLGDPQKTFKYVHVAGTNGKGTVVKSIGSILSAHGLKVGTYFSPHLETFRERIRIDDIYISREDAVKVFEDVSSEAKKMGKTPEEEPTFFEIVTAMAFLYFKSMGVDVVVSEVGLGGRFDATNVVDNPLCSVITSIDYDHMETLGSTLEQIAFEKSGIIKPKFPVILGKIDPGALKVITSKAKESESDVRLFGRDFNCEVRKFELGKNAFDFKGKRWNFSFETRLNGVQAVENLTTSLATLELLEEQGIFKANEEKLFNTVFTMSLEGRFEWLPADITIVLDVAHNTPAMRMVKENLNLYFPQKHVNAVMGILNDKDYKGMINTIAPVVDKLYITTPKSSRATDSFQIYTWAVKNYDNVGFVKKIEEAVKTCDSMSKRKKDVMLISGSFYTVGAARTFLTGNMEADRR